mgnify:CR=1 FL=1
MAAIEPIDKREPSFIRGISFTFLILLLSIPVALVPLVNVLAITMVPYLSTAVGSRFAHPRDRLPLAVTTSVLWSLLETGVIVSIFTSLRTPAGFYLDSIGTLLLVMIWAFNIFFSILGSIHTWKDPYRDLV